MAGGIEVRPAAAQKTELQRAWVGHGDRQDAAELEFAGGLLEDLQGIRQVLQNVPEGHRASFAKRPEHRDGIVAADGCNTNSLGEIPTALGVHLDRCHLEPGIVGGGGKSSGSRSDLDQAAGLYVPSQELDTDRLHLLSVPVRPPRRLAVGSEMVVAATVVPSEIGWDGGQESRCAGRAADVGEALLRDLAIAIHRLQGATANAPADGAGRCVSGGRADVHSRSWVACS